jgi:hypothetical protein
MGLIIQIILSIVAWNRGWKWLALIPVVGGFLLGFIIGLIATSMGYSTEDLQWAIIFDIIVFIILIIMCIKKPKSAELPTEPSEKLPEPSEKPSETQENK